MEEGYRAIRFHTVPTDDNLTFDTRRMARPESRQV